MFSGRESALHNVTAEDHVRITAAIGDAEKKTSGEVYAVVAHQSDSYFFVSGFMAAVWTLFLGTVAAVLALVLDINLPAIVLAGAELASFLASLAVIWFFPSLRYLLVPRSIAYRRASNNAMRQFLSHGIHTTSDRSGVLLFMSLAEHYAEVVADEGINARVQQGDWDGIVSAMTSHAANGQVADGFIVAIEEAGALLAQNFPPNKDPKNELNDRLVEI